MDTELINLYVLFRYIAVFAVGPSSSKEYSIMLTFRLFVYTSLGESPSELAKSGVDFIYRISYILMAYSIIILTKRPPTEIIK